MKKGWTQSEMAQRLADRLSHSYSLRAYQKLESGEFPKFKKEIIRQLEQILGIKILEEIYEQRVHTQTPNDAEISKQHLEPTEFQRMYVEAMEELKQEMKDHRKSLEEQQTILMEHNRFLQGLINTNLTLVLATVRTISVRQEATGETVLHSLERLEKKGKGSLVSVADKRRDQIEQAFSKHDNVVAQSR